MRARWWRPACRHPGCGHTRDGHPSFVPNGDEPGYCASCKCWKYRPERPWTRLLAWIRRPPAPVPADVLRQHPVPYPVRARAVYDDRTMLDIPRARPFTAGQAGVHAPGQRGGPPW